MGPYDLERGWRGIEHRIDRTSGTAVMVRDFSIHLETVTRLISRPSPRARGGLIPPPNNNRGVLRMARGLRMQRSWALIVVSVVCVGGCGGRTTHQVTGKVQYQD